MQSNRKISDLTNVTTCILTLHILVSATLKSRFTEINLAYPALCLLLPLRSARYRSRKEKDTDPDDIPGLCLTVFPVRTGNQPEFSGRCVKSPNCCVAFGIRDTAKSTLVHSRRPQPQHLAFRPLYTSPRSCPVFCSAKHFRRT